MHTIYGVVPIVATIDQAEALTYTVAEPKPPPASGGVPPKVTSIAPRPLCHALFLPRGAELRLELVRPLVVFAAVQAP